MTSLPDLSEFQIHCAIADYLDLALPAAYVHTSIGHGGGGKVRGARLKRMGMKRGVGDILVWLPEDPSRYTAPFDRLNGDCLFSYAGVLRGIAMECKTRTGSATNEQIAMAQRLGACGWTTVVVRSPAQAYYWLCGLGIPVRARPT